MENQNWTSTEEVRTGDLTRGPVWRVIVRFAVPLLIGNIRQQLYNITDSIIVGQFLGKEALAAVSASFFIYYFIYEICTHLMFLASFQRWRSVASTKNINLTNHPYGNKTRLK